MLSSPLDNLTASDIQIIKAFAGANMRIASAAKEVGVNDATVFRRLRYIYKKSKLNPCKFRDLVLLMQLIEGDDFVYKE